MIISWESFATVSLPDLSFLCSFCFCKLFNYRTFSLTISRLVIYFLFAMVRGLKKANHDLSKDLMIVSGISKNRILFSTKILGKNRREEEDLPNSWRQNALATVCFPEEEETACAPCEWHYWSEEVHYAYFFGEEHLLFVYLCMHFGKIRWETE